MAARRIVITVPIAMSHHGKVGNAMKLIESEAVLSLLRKNGMEFPQYCQEITITLRPFQPVQVTGTYTASAVLESFGDHQADGTQTTEDKRDGTQTQSTLSAYRD